MLTTPLSILLAFAHPEPVLGIALVARGMRIALVEDGRVLARCDEVGAAQRARVDLLLARHGRGQPNLPLPTAAGLQMWADVFWGCGWRIQRHVWTGHHRLVDPAGIRRAWGDHAACRAVYEDRRVALGLQPPRRLVLALAGLGGTRHALAPVAAAIGADDELALIAYPSTRAPIAAHAAGLRALLGDLSGVQQVVIITHSLGALVARTALAAPADERAPWPQLAGLVMLFPPNRGAALADRWHRMPAYRWLLGPAGQELTTAAASAVPLPRLRFVTIAGGRGDGRGRNRQLTGDNDGTVRVEETLLPGACAHHVIDVGHTCGLRDPRVLAVVRRTLQGWSAKVAMPSGSMRRYKPEG